jgi:peptide-methionine (R)-S-oxide reductase
MKRRHLLFAALSAAVLAACRRVGLQGRERGGETAPGEAHSEMNALEKGAETMEIIKTEEEWRAKLTPQEFNVLRQKGTEYAFSGEYWDHKAQGVYICAACGNQLFSSDTKFASGTGWPSFWAPIDEQNVGTESDTTLGMRRVEVHCARCGGHLGHVFNDGPQPTGLRYCINSVSLDFEPAE